MRPLTPADAQVVLDKLAANYGRSDVWVRDNLQTWSKVLARYTLDELEAAVDRWVATEAKPPSLHAIGEKLADLRAANRHQLDTCGHCDHTGWRRWAWHRREVADSKYVTVSVYVAPCTCDLGRVRPGANVDVIAQFHQNLALTTAVYIETEQEPLTLEQTLSPRHLTAHRRRQAKAKPTPTAKPTPPPVEWPE